MSLAPAISRGRALKARFAVNGIQNCSRSLGTFVATAGWLDAMLVLLKNTDSKSGCFGSQHTINESDATETGRFASIRYPNTPSQYFSTDEHDVTYATIACMMVR